jgi:hypothetical protein
MIKSECRGEALKIIPKRSISYRLIAECIISTAQQANPKVKGHKEPARAHAIIDNNLVEIHSSFIFNKKKLFFFF